ncbi:MAG: CinA family protein, partial [Vogesella sp.]|uniref:CinA family protein n=1 Tax=Vogesella sp. TaxID=1904252 RepID=UPI003F3B5F56
TGGGVAAALTAIPGSSAWFDLSVVTYSNEAKQRLLGVPQATLQAHGAVSLPVAAAMAEGARSLAGADWAMAVTGIAGPGGGTAEKPVGTVCFAVAHAAGTAVRSCHFDGDRDAVRAQAVVWVLGFLQSCLSGQGAA